MVTITNDSSWLRKSIIITIDSSRRLKCQNKVRALPVLILTFISEKIPVQSYRRSGHLHRLERIDKLTKGGALLLLALLPFLQQIVPLLVKVSLMRQQGEVKDLGFGKAEQVHG